MVLIATLGWCIPGDLLGIVAHTATEGRHSMDLAADASVGRFTVGIIPRNRRSLFGPCCVILPTCLLTGDTVCSGVHRRAAVLPTWFVRRLCAWRLDCYYFV
ncbi:hypothetical protein DFH09DRAFT_1193668 [Mycena vulgaris]|nr:hypothetical protein DFH09DRAFT_1193668 [Mycena vulgaris]